MHVCYLHEFLCIIYVACSSLWGPEGGIRSPGSVVIGSCEPLWVLDTKPGSSKLSLQLFKNKQMFEGFSFQINI